MSNTGYNEQTVQYYDQNAEEYIKFTDGILLTDYIDEFLNMLSPNTMVLDAGCAQGRDAAYMHSKGFKVTGIDGAKSIIKYAQNKHSDIEFRVSDVRSTDFTQDTFGGVLCSAVILHFNDADASDVIK